jgi:ribosomal protein S18 acetylase RimI-like enzyme
MLATTHQLSQPDLQALTTLLSACHATDHAVIPVYPHLLETYRPGLSSFLYYHHQQLIGFLACFHFYSDAAEVALLIHPSYRQKGLAKTLWETMYSKIPALYPQLHHLIVSSPHGFNQAWFNQHQFCFKNTEYNMMCTPYIPHTSHQRAYTIKTADDSDINQLHAIDHICFNAHRPDPIQRIKALLETPHIKILLMFHNKQLTGQVHLVFEKNQMWITDFAILPGMQQQGFGETLLSHCLKYAYEHQLKKVHLTVSSQNESAHHLYQSMGFQIYNAVDYYKGGFSLDNF